MLEKQSHYIYFIFLHASMTCMYIWSNCYSYFWKILMETFSAFGLKLKLWISDLFNSVLACVTNKVVYVIFLVITYLEFLPGVIFHFFFLSLKGVSSFIFVLLAFLSSQYGCFYDQKIKVKRKKRLICCACQILLLVWQRDWERNAVIWLIKSLQNTNFSSTIL